jgi:hypothetical protein
MDISVVVATYNGGKNLMMVLTSLAASQIPPGYSWEVIIVDNNSTDQTRAIAESFIARGHQNVRYLFEPRRGKSFALNTGIRESKGRIIAFTDDDCIVDVKWIRSILQEYSSDPSLVAIGGRVELYDPKDKPSTIRISNQRNLISLTPFEPWFSPIIGCNMALKREVFDAVGYFDEDLGPGSKYGLVAEDIDLLYQIYKNRLKVVYVPELLVYHNHGRRTDGNWSSVNRDYVRGRGAFYCKYALRRDVAVLKMAYWEVLLITKTILRRLFAGGTVRNELRVLLNLVIGAIYEFGAYLRGFQHNYSR